MYNDISQIPQGEYGICGFVCMLQMLIDKGKMTLKGLEEQYADSSLRFAEEWVNIQIEHDQNLRGQPAATALNQSVRFTQNFGEEFSKLTVKQLLDQSVHDWGRLKGFALTPEAISDYLLRKFSLHTKFDIYDPYPGIRSILDQNGKGKQGIYGIGNQGKLRHWVYVDKKGTLMTWTRTGQTALNALTAGDTPMTIILVRITPV